MPPFEPPLLVAGSTPAQDLILYWRVAQLVERLTVNQEGGGSSPPAPAKKEATELVAGGTKIWWGVPCKKHGAMKPSLGEKRVPVVVVSEPKTRRTSKHTGCPFCRVEKSVLSKDEISKIP